MKLKYYLRGLGIGIIVTALVMSIGGKKQNTEPAAIETKESKDILAIDNSKVEADNIFEPSQTIYEENSNENEVAGDYEPETENVISGEMIQDDNSYDNNIEETAAQETTTQESSVEEKQVEEEELPKEVQALLEQNEVLSFEVVRGDDSATVARKLYNAGFVDNAKQFDAFLTQHGYDKKIKVGVKKIPKGSTWIEIAQKLSSN